MLRNLVICALISSIIALPKSSVENDMRNSIISEKDFIEGIHNDCLNQDSVSCLKYKLYNFVDKILAKRESISLTEGITVVQNANVSPVLNENEGTPRDLFKTESFESLLWKRIEQFFETHSIKVDVQGKDIINAVSSTGRALEELLDDDSDDSANEIEEQARGKKKKAAKILGPLIAAAAVKLAALVPLALGAIAIIAGKALLIGKIALVISAIIGLKKLLSQKHVTYEVVSHHGGGGNGHDFSSASDISSGAGYSGASAGASSSGWGRSLQEEESAQHLAYRGHLKNNV